MRYQSRSYNIFYVACHVEFVEWIKDPQQLDTTVLLPCKERSDKMFQHSGPIIPYLCRVSTSRGQFSM